MEYRLIVLRKIVCILIVWVTMLSDSWVLEELNLRHYILPVLVSVYHSTWCHNSEYYNISVSGLQNHIGFI
jgi:hypothetical protein